MRKSSICNYYAYINDKSSQNTQQGKCHIQPEVRTPSSGSQTFMTTSMTIFTLLITSFWERWAPNYRNLLNKSQKVVHWKSLYLLLQHLG